MASERTSDKPRRAGAAPQLDGVLRWIARGRHTGFLKLTAPDAAAPDELAFIAGELYLPAAHPLAAALGTSDGGPGVERLLRDLAAALPACRVGAFRFSTTLRPTSPGFIGPLPTARLLPPPTAAPGPHPAVAAIWRDQFQLAADPFSLTPDPAFLFLSRGHAEALAGLKVGLWERRGLLVLIGEVGTGKTTLAYSLLSDLDPQIETAYLSNTLLSFEEILKSALHDFGVEVAGWRRLDLVDAFHAFLRRSADAGKTAALVIDEAQNLSDEAFEGLRLLLNFETATTKLLQIVLVGQPELGARLVSPRLRQIDDRVAVRCRLGPLDRREARRYIDHRLEKVGGSANIFTWPALGLLVRKSRGIPRRINILCHNAMLNAYGKNHHRVDRAIVAQAIRDL